MIREEKDLVHQYSRSDSEKSIILLYWCWSVDRLTRSDPSDVRWGVTILPDISCTDEDLLLLSLLHPPVEHSAQTHHLSSSSWLLSTEMNVDVEKNEWDIHGRPRCLQRWIDGFHCFLFIDQSFPSTLIFIVMEMNFLVAVVCFVRSFNPLMINFDNTFQIDAEISWNCLYLWFFLDWLEKILSSRWHSSYFRIGLTLFHVINVFRRRSSHPLIHPPVKLLWSTFALRRILHCVRHRSKQFCRRTTRKKIINTQRRGHLSSDRLMGRILLLFKPARKMHWIKFTLILQRCSFTFAS